MRVVIRLAYVASVLISLSLIVLFQRSAEASCGAVSCFIVIGSQQQIPQKGLLTVNGIYNYTPMYPQSGTSGIIPEVDQANRRLIPNHHRELSTITQTYTLDLNYGLTDRWGLELTVPYMLRKHDHTHFHMGSDAELIRFSDNGIGDIRLTVKYNALTTLRSMMVAGFGIELPTGNIYAKDSDGGLMEAPMQIGRGQLGVVGTLYQTYELIPHRLNQFSFVSYRHTFRNNFGYQFGDEYLLNAGVNLVTVPWLVLTNQVNYRYRVHDNFSASMGGSPIMDLDVPTTGQTFLAYTPGVMVNVGESWQAYFYSQIPVARDSNGNLVQGVSYTFGITKYFTTL